MGTTPKGLPWPAGTDYLAQTWAYIKALADAIDPLLTPPSYCARYATATLNITDSVWTLAGLTTNDFVVGPDLAYVSSGITVKTPGIYRIEAFVQWGSVATGNRTIGVDLLGATAATGFRRQLVAGALTATQTAVWTSNLAAGDYGIWVNHSAGVVVPVTNRRLLLQRVY